MHTEVRERRLPEDTVYAAVFPAVAEGRYTLLGTEGEVRREVTIRSGRVTEVAWYRTGRRVRPRFRGPESGKGVAVLAPLPEARR